MDIKYAIKLVFLGINLALAFRNNICVKIELPIALFKHVLKEKLGPEDILDRKFKLVAKGMKIVFRKTFKCCNIKRVLSAKIMK